MKRLIEAGASESVFDAVSHQLARHGHIARRSRIIDASIVQVPKRSRNKEEKSLVQDNAMAGQGVGALGRSFCGYFPRTSAMPPGSLFSRVEGRFGPTAHVTL